jgi:hypothetical protein
MATAVNNERLADIAVEQHAEAAQPDAADLDRPRISDTAGLGDGRCYRAGNVGRLNCRRIDAIISRFGHLRPRYDSIETMVEPAHELIEVGFQITDKMTAPFETGSLTL